MANIFASFTKFVSSMYGLRFLVCVETITDKQCNFVLDGTAYLSIIYYRNGFIST